MAENYIDLKFIADTAPLERAEKVADRLEKRINKLVSEEAKGRITTQQYSAEVRKMASEMQKAAGGTIQARNAVNSYSRAVYQAAEEARQFAAAAQASQKAIHRQGVVMQQVGYQTGDFIVQVQSGTNAFVAFGQQATQLVGVMGMLNPKLIGVGAALGIIIPLATAFGAAWLRSRQETDKAAQSSNLLAEKIKALDESLKEYALTKQALERGMPLEQMFAVDELARAEKQLVDLKDALNSITARGVLTQTAESIPFLADLLGISREDQIAKLEELIKKAEERIVAVREKLADEAAKKQRKSEAELAQNRLDSQEKWNQWRSRSNDKYFAEEQRKAKEVADKVAEEQAASVEAMKVSINQYMDVYEAGVAEMVRQHAELNDLASELGERLGISFATAVAIIRQAKAEATVGLDAFGGAGDFKYSYPSTFKPPKNKTGGGARKETAEQYLQALMAEAEYKQRIVGLSEEQSRVEEILFQAKQKELVVTREQAAAIAAVEEQTRRMIEAEQRRKSMMDSISGHIENAFMAIVDGSASVEDAFKGMIRSILLDVYRQMVAKPAADFIVSLFSAKGNVFNNGSHIQAYANGGVVGTPTYFPMAGGKTGLMGEAGPEAIMPLKRGSNGKLGVEMHGGGQVVVNQTINLSTGVQQTVRAEVKAMMPQIAEQSKAAVLDAKRRGGAYGGKF